VKRPDLREDEAEWSRSPTAATGRCDRPCAIKEIRRADEKNRAAPALKKVRAVAPKKGRRRRPDGTEAGRLRQECAPAES